MKFLFELILGTIIIFFVWNILKRVFFKSFYKYTGFKPNNVHHQETKKSSDTSIEKKVKWDAETVEYEEVKDKNNVNH